MYHRENQHASVTRYFKTQIFRRGELLVRKRPVQVSNKYPEICPFQTGWLKFRELSGLLIGKGMSLKSKGIIYTTCIRPVMLYGSETWPTKIEDIRKMQRNEMRMLRWMTGVSLSERKSNECVRSMLAIDDVCWSHASKQVEVVWSCWEERWVVLDKENWDTAGRWWWSER